MPTDHSVGLDDHQQAIPRWPRLGKEHPEQSIPAIEARRLAFSLKNGQLMPQSDDFGSDVTTRFEEREGS